MSMILVSMPPSKIKIFDMDEAGFDLVYKWKVKKIAPCTHECNRQAVPPPSEHIISVATTGIDSALVPSLFI